MGKVSLLLVLALAITFGIHSLTVNRRASAAVANYSSYYSKEMARNINNSTLQLALRQLSDNQTWRTGYNNLTVLGGKSTLTLRDTTVAGNAAVCIRCTSVCSSDTAIGSVIVRPRLVPPVIRAAFTAFGPLDATISDMYIDGQNHTDVVTSVGPPAKYQLATAGTGYFGVSTGAPLFVNTQNGLIGGTDKTTSPPVDITPSFPNSSKVVETSSPWPHGFPKTPDAAMDWPEGTLKAIAKSGVNGSRYIQTEKQLDSLVKKKLPLDGVTYIDVSPADTQWEYNNNNKLPDGSGGILVFHCDTKIAYWNRIEFVTGTQTFKGLLIFDKFFHIHINVLGAVVMLTSNTITNDVCPLNKDKTIALSTSIISKYTGQIVPTISGGWHSKLMLLSWFE